MLTVRKLFVVTGLFAALSPFGTAQTTLPPAAVPTVRPVTLSLDELIEEAQQRNPALQAALHMVEARRSRIPQAKTPPEPALSAGWAGNLTPLSIQKNDPASYRGITISQQFLYPGKLQLRGDIAARDADAAWWDYEELRRRTIADLKMAFYDYVFYSKAIEITERNKALLQQLADISQARYRVGKTAQQDVLKSQVEVSMLLQRLTTLQQQTAASQVRLNTLVYRPTDRPLPPPAEVQPTVLKYSLDDLYRLAAQNDTGLHREEQLLQRDRLAIDLAHKDYRPDLTAAYMYQQRPLMPDMNGVTLTVSIPVFYRSRQRQALREATEERLSEERTRDARRSELFSQVRQQFLAIKASEQLLQLFSRGIVPQASLAFVSSVSAYQVGSVDFLNVLSNFSNVLSNQIDYYRELANYQSAIAQLESLVGVELTNTPSAPGSSLATLVK